MSNNKIGRNTENKFQNLVRHHFNGVSIKFPRSIHGQPFDMMAVFKGRVWFVDIKHCSGTRFNFSNVQANQRLSLELLEQKRGQAMYKLGFMIYFRNIQRFKFLKYTDFRDMETKGDRSILFNDERLRMIG